MSFRKTTCFLALAAFAASAVPATAASPDVVARFLSWCAVRESSLSGDRAALAAEYERIADGLGRILEARIRISADLRAVLADLRGRASGRASELRAVPAAVTPVQPPAAAPVSPVSAPVQTGASPVLVAKAANGGKEIGSSALRFTVSVDENSKYPFTLAAADVAAQLVGYAGSAVINIYRTDVSAANRIGSAAVTGAAQRVALSSGSGLNRVDPGATAQFVVTVEGVVFDAAARTRDWTVRVNDLDLGPLVPSAAAYSNIGAFPLVETR